MGLIAISVVVLAFWQFNHTEHSMVRRAFTVTNINDSSWRNRIASWEGTLQIMAERPWFGFGWNGLEPMYDNYYRPTKVQEAAAIRMNDYFTLGATLGLPALLYFGAYIWLALRQNPKPKIPNLESLQMDRLQTTCRAGAIVLLVGFWFDGGLFKLSTASTFWILLELGRTDLMGIGKIDGMMGMRLNRKHIHRDWN
jgi:O-antigen ligase